MAVDGPGGEEAGADSALVAALRAEIAKRDEVIARLEKQLKVLTEKLNQNSKNSHRPPSSDSPGRKADEPQKPKSDKKRGGQPGHRGNYRQLLPSASVDKVEDFFPEVCLGCAGALPEIPDAKAYRYQQLEIVDHRPHLTEYRRHQVRCEGCGTRTRAAHNSQIPSSAFGPNLTAVAGMLTGVYHLSRRKAQQILFELFGISISLGALSTLERRTSEALKAAYEEAKRAVDQAAVKNADATPWLILSRLVCLWVMASAKATAFSIVPNGSHKEARPVFNNKEPSEQFGILGGDRAAVLVLLWRMAYRQICWAHLIRKFIAFSERDGPARSIGRELKAYALLVFFYWHSFRDGHLTRAELRSQFCPVQSNFERALKRAASAGIPRLSRSRESMLAHREALWNFVEHEGVEPTNNHAERELRAFVLWRKGFGSQSERGARFAERLMTVAHTARKQGKRVFVFISRSVTAYVNGLTPPQLIDPVS